METFSGSLPQQQANTPENTPNLPQATSPSRQKTTTSPLQHHSIEKKKRERHSVEFKSKILSELENSSQAELARLYKIDQRLIGKWAKPENKENILKVVGKRGTFRIETESNNFYFNIKR